MSDQEQRPLPAVLLLAYRRPDTTALVLEALRQVRPPRLFVACDGPRPGDPAEAQACAATRALIESEVDWPCACHWHLRNEHLGCRRGVSEAISWFFEQVEEGIILEDDIVASPRFFSFCSELLEHYRNDTRIGVISGSNFQPQRPRDGASYYFSLYNHGWGWASWRRAWATYDAELEGWPAFRDQGWLEDLGGKRFARYWSRCLERVHGGECDTWDYIWTYSCWRQGLLTCLPAVNLVTNVGFGHPQATHTNTGSTPHGSIGDLEAPLRHPAQCLPDGRADRHTFLTQFQPPLALRALGRLRRLLA
ncbi:hypothetical protein [Cyanobium sp. ATX 6F1]|uniref:hypothetical protein n=1 Tax=Cyanobium sp. ATX 6F1 TaxID=2823702 RepID=UPI0020CC0025|nr:hypothetical protein [Cyanobium sp. ATX 6F1]MCP9917450.1 glycosyltransferase family 2 protein [Cyanobium sp. ATX 6F1]